MITIARRTVRSSPYRSAQDTWETIVELLTGRSSGPIKTTLIAVRGIAASVISDHAPATAPIVVTCDGPRTRIYCTYDEDALDGSGANEEPLGFDAVKGDWHVSLPCEHDDLAWVQKALAKHGERVTARAADENVEKAEKEQSDGTLTIDPKEFLGS